MRTIRHCAATFVAALALALTAAPLAAQTVEFSGHGHSYNTNDFLTPGDFSFQYFLPQSPIPSLWGENTFTTAFVTATVTQGGSTQAVTSFLRFYTSAAFGGFLIGSSNTGVVALMDGPVLFSGTTSAPTFIVGTYTGFTPFADEFPTTISDVTISNVSSTPEPSSMALIGTGLVGLIPMVRRRRK